MKNDAYDINEEDRIKKKILDFVDNLDHRLLAIWATDCAEHVLSFFEEQYPEDNRPRKAIDAGRAWVHGTISVGEARTAAFAAHAAARDAEEGVARAAGHAAATAHVAGHAVYAANYAAVVDVQERDWQYQHLLNLTKERTLNNEAL